jgi:hypothetical protein
VDEGDLYSPLSFATFFTLLFVDFISRGDFYVAFFYPAYLIQWCPIVDIFFNCNRINVLLFGDILMHLIGGHIFQNG